MFVVRVLNVAVLGLALCVIGGLGCWVYYERADIFKAYFTREIKAEPDAERYGVLVEELERWREELGAKYARARTADERAAVENDARLILEMVLPEMMRCWLGTGYDFNGTTERPGNGKVACGYFVSTVLRDAGFKVDRYKLAQQPSGNIMRSFVGSDACELKVGVKYEEYVDWFEGKEPGIYLMGLDTHVGFVVNDGEGMRFLHSSGIGAAGVVEEARGDAEAIRRSRWRMLGKFSGEPKVIRTWLKGENVRVMQ